MKKRKFRYFVGDFETTVYDNQEHTEVWASAIVELHTEDVEIHHSIDETFKYIRSLKSNVCIYYHNLKFDGAFWLSYLLLDKKFTQAYETLNPLTGEVRWLKEKEMKNNSFKYSISDMGQWYTITIKVDNYIIEIRDSLKLLPFSVKRIGNSFKTKHKKSNMEYKGYRYAGCEITDSEKEYIANDVLVIKEAIEIMFQEGHDKLTIGSCCLGEFINSIGGQEIYNEEFPDMYAIEINPNNHKYLNVGEWCRATYKGGWCYVVKGKENKLYYNGTTADVNSLYPSMMSSESGNKYPVGLPHFWKGDIPNYIKNDNEIYYFVRIRTRFYLKDGYLPFIQIKNNLLYKGTECLETSDIFDKQTGEYYTHYYDNDGNLCSTAVELSLTMTDFELLKEHYHLVEFEMLDGCWFRAEIGIFDKYIEKYKQLKLTSTGALRELAKLFLNNLYGKMASNTNSSFKVAYVKDDKSIGFYPVRANDKKAGYIPIGSAITSYARNFTIRTAQKNYYGKDKAGFIYADTDSIHCDLTPEQLNGVTVHDKNFCCWKLESQWDVGLFTRQKTYIEHIVIEDGKEIETPYYNVKCAGMPEKCKDLFIKSITNYTIKDTDEFTDEEKEFIQTPRRITDFKIGLKVPGKLLPIRVKGGIILKDTSYEMR